MPDSFDFMIYDIKDGFLCLRNDLQVISTHELYG